MTKFYIFQLTMAFAILSCSKEDKAESGEAEATECCDFKVPICRGAPKDIGPPIRKIPDETGYCPRRFQSSSESANNALSCIDATDLDNLYDKVGISIDPAQIREVNRKSECPDDWIKVRALPSSEPVAFDLGCSLQPVEQITDFAKRFSCVQVEKMNDIVSAPTSNELGEILLDPSQVIAPLGDYTCPEGTIRVKTKEAIVPTL